MLRIHAFAGALLASTILSSNAAVAATAEAEDQQTSVGTGQSDEAEITVTARRRSETSQEVPVAISVIGGEHIDNTGSFNVGRLTQLTPTLQL